jgi:hypothetical protein
MISINQELVLGTKLKGKLQMTAHRLNTIAKKYNLKISTSKTKSIGMCGNEIQSLKMMIKGKIIEQVTEFVYLGNKISHNKDMKYKLQTYSRISGIIKETFW